MPLISDTQVAVHIKKITFEINNKLGNNKTQHEMTLKKKKNIELKNNNNRR